PADRGPASRRAGSALTRTWLPPRPPRGPPPARPPRPPPTGPPGGRRAGPRCGPRRILRRPRTSQGRRCAARLVRVLAERGEAAPDRHEGAGHADVCFLLDLPLTGPALNLLDRVGPVPDPGPAAADVPAAGRDRRRTIDGEVLAGEEVQRL